MNKLSNCGNAESQWLNQFYIDLQSPTPYFILFKILIYTSIFNCWKKFRIFMIESKVWISTNEYKCMIVHVYLHDFHNEILIISSLL